MLMADFYLMAHKTNLIKPILDKPIDKPMVDKTNLYACNC